VTESFPFLLALTLFGACVGSFFNVVIWRVPRGKSVVWPGSHCPGCDAAIPGWRNLPIVTWLFQRGRAACCGTAIAPRYVLVEAFAAALSLGWGIALQAGLWDGDYRAAVGWYVLALLAIPVSLIDWEFFIIPDGLNLTGFVIGLGVAIGFGGWTGFVTGLRDALLCAGGLYLLSWTFRWGLWKLGMLSKVALERRWARKGVGRCGAASYRGALQTLRRWSGFDENTEALGLGDVNLMVAAGALIGPAAVAVGIPLAACLGIVGYAVRALFPRSAEQALEAGVDAHAVPFGPFLCAGMLLAQPWTPRLLEHLFPG
jgi:prepilin signal peptidase PulO-like enzyme (type II secretory pathway)